MLDRAHRFLPRTSLKTVGLGLALVVALAASACTKSEGQTSASTSTTGTTAASSAPSASATEATATPDAALTPTDGIPGAALAAGAGATAPAGSAAGSAAAPTVASAAGAAGSAEAGAIACGKKPLPDCPLQGWMKANTNPAVSANDLPALAIALEKIVTFAPPGYTNWASISKDGAKAARGGDMTAVKASCRTCHDQYKDRYKKEMRARKI